MLNHQLLNPRSIVVVGGSEERTRPGGKILHNILEGGYKGNLFVVNPKYGSKLGNCPNFSNIRDCPPVDLAILAVSCQYTKEMVKVLAEEKGCKAFIILSAGFSEMGEEGKKLEQEIVQIINEHQGSLIGPNCIGVLTPNYHGVFAGAIPSLNPKGCDFVSSSGATAAFIIDKGIPLGLTFATVFSVGNAAQIGVEEVLEYWDTNYNPETSSSIKIIYMETVHHPQKFLKHARSLVEKGCRLAAIKAGCSEAGKRAASSHTGALASSNTAVEAMLKKAGVVRCESAEELLLTAAVFMHQPLMGKKLAIITHAGGPGVMITDALSQGGLEVPQLTGVAADKLKEQLFPGSSVSNPIDFLATGTAEQLNLIIDAVEHEFDVDGMVVIFGTPGLMDVTPVYQSLHKKMQQCRKPVYPVLPSVTTAKEAIDVFKGLGHAFFPDEVALARTLSHIVKTPKPAEREKQLIEIDHQKMRDVIERNPRGYLPPHEVANLLDAAGIPRVKESVCQSVSDAIQTATTLGYPLVMKVVGPLHKSDGGGVVLNISSIEQVKDTYEKLMGLPKAIGVLIQPQITGRELFVGAKREGDFGHILLCGLGGIFIEVLKDTTAGLVPLTSEEGLQMIRSLKGYGVVRGARGQEGIDEKLWAEILHRLSLLLETVPEILEMDINPLLGNSKSITAVDARICIDHP